MGYIKDIEQEFRAVLARGDEEEIVKFFKDKVYESYKNGASSSKKVDTNKEAGGN